MSLILYTDAARLSPFVLTAWAALKEKQLDFELRDVALDQGEQHLPEFRDHAVIGKVPALVHDDFWVTESVAIAEYLAETFPFPGHPRIFPGDFKERARCRQLMLWLRTDNALNVLRQERPTSLLFSQGQRSVAPTLSHEAAAAAATLCRIAGQLLQTPGEGSPPRRTLFAAWCIADVDLGLMLQRLRACGDPLPTRLAAYADAQWERPSVRSFIDLPRPTP